MRKLPLLLFALLISTCFVGFASASISTSVIPKLYYDDGTYITLPAGTYTSLYRQDNVWYVNGKVYPASAVAPTFSIATIFTSIYGAVALAGIIPIIISVLIIVVAIRNKEELEGNIVYLIPVLMITGILMIICGIAIGVIQGAFV